MENLSIYNATREVPKAALRAIQAGRLKGKSDINPMWRIKTLTEQFGPCGIGWKYTIDKQWLEAGAGNEQAAFVNISLYIKIDGQWSDAIPGTGGSSFVAQEKSGPYTSDECFKMALTDAISVACKALGFGADVYWEADKTKYSGSPVPQPQIQFINIEQQSALRELLLACGGYDEDAFLAEAKIKSLSELPVARYKGAFNHIQNKSVQVAA